MTYIAIEHCNIKRERKKMKKKWKDKSIVFFFFRFFKLKFDKFAPHLPLQTYAFKNSFFPLLVETTTKIVGKRALNPSIMKIILTIEIQKLQFSYK